jgi:hypothetical protein
MQTRRGLIEHVHDAEQIRLHLCRESQPLQLTRRQRRRAALKGQVTQAKIEDDFQACLKVFHDALRDDRLLWMFFFQYSPFRARALYVRLQQLSEPLER